MPARFGAAEEQRAESTFQFLFPTMGLSRRPVAGQGAFHLLGNILYPLFMLTALGSGMALMSRGVSPAAAIALVVAVAALCAALLERALPFEKEWNRSHHGDLRADIIHALVSNGIAIQLARALLVAVFVAGAGVGPANLWPTETPLLLQTALGLVIGELFFYGAHRLMHETDRGFSLHSVHHSSERLYWLNGLRVHPLQALVSTGCFQLPLYLLGAPLEVMALVGIFHSCHGLLQHGNVDVRLGPLNWIVSGPELHRWHHSPDLAEANHNYGNNLIVWDVVFGTRYLPAGGPPRKLGLADLPSFPHRYLDQLLVPFRWEAVKRAASRGSSDSGTQATAARPATGPEEAGAPTA